MTKTLLLPSGQFFLPHIEQINCKHAELVIKQFLIIHNETKLNLG